MHSLDFKCKRFCCPADEHVVSCTDSMTKTDTTMKNVEIHWASSGEGRANTQAFHICSACSIFNVSQLTAAQTGSLVKNATHVTTPAWQAHALVVLCLCRFSVIQDMVNGYKNKF